MDSAGEIESSDRPLKDQTVSVETVEAEAVPAEKVPRRVLIISADIGEGHDLPARAVAREFREADPDALISIVNGLEAMNPFARSFLRNGSDWTYRWVPWLFDLEYRLMMNFPPLRWLAQRLLMLFGAAGMLKLVRSHTPDIIVSTYPGVTAILGELRLQGRIDVPCYSSITDLAGLRFWSHPGIDMHFVTHPESIEEVEQIAGPGSVRWAKPPTSPTFMEPRSREEARESLDLSLDCTVIVVSGGGWGVGDVLGAVETALAVDGDIEVLCLCGHNARLRERVSARFGGDPRLRVMGFTRQMSDVLSAADVLVHSSVGLTVLEALIRGCPVISYGFGYGHVRVSNQALVRFDLAQVASSQKQLAAALARALGEHPEPDDSFVKRPSTAELVLADERRIVPSPAWRVRVTRAATVFAVTGIVGFWGATAALAYTLVSQVAHTDPVTSVPIAKSDVGVLIETSQQQLQPLAQKLERAGVHVSFAVKSGSPEIVDSVADRGDEVLPLLSDGGLVNWLHTRRQLHNLVHEFGLSRHFLYVSTGPSLAQWELARTAGGKLVAGHVLVHSDGRIRGDLRRGEVIELRIYNARSADSELDALLTRLKAEHLHAVPVSKLLQESGYSL